jgi:hypothetical protein
VVVVILGLIYFFIPPKEANHSLGYRFYWGMGSVEAWRFTQKIAGLSWSVVGLVMSLVMLLITNGYRGMELLAMTENAAKCLLWEIGILAVLCLAIDVVVALRYDRKGNVRPKTVIRVPDNFLEFRNRMEKKGEKAEQPRQPMEQPNPAPEFESPAAQASEEFPVAPAYFEASAPTEQMPAQFACPVEPLPMQAPTDAAAPQWPPETRLPPQTNA